MSALETSALPSLTSSAGYHRGWSLGQYSLSSTPPIWSRLLQNMVYCCTSMLIIAKHTAPVALMRPLCWRPQCHNVSTVSPAGCGVIAFSLMVMRHMNLLQLRPVNTDAHSTYHVTMLWHTYLRQICTIGHSSDAIVVALVHSWLDYENGVLVGLPAYLPRNQVVV